MSDRSLHTPTIVGADALADLASLEPIARAIFGEGDRPAGWFERKLRRERVDPRLSVIAREGASIVGYALLGAPPSLPGVARAAGMGVIPTHRGRGLGSALLAAAAERARSAGLRRLHTLAGPERVGFYERFGMLAIARLHTLLAAPPEAPADVAFGGALRLGAPLPWALPGATEVAGWLAEAWSETPDPLRASAAIGAAGGDPIAWAHLSREGRAWLCQRLLVADGSPLEREGRALAAAEALRRSLAADAPLLLYGLPAVSAITDALLQRGWRVVQEGVVMERVLAAD
ncbi:MAG: GNAT family N-acetyltransferase [Myxococcales bacterium]|nr:GNAT family N-acetyltransferase [Myxococcales bacterium]